MKPTNQVTTLVVDNGLFVDLAIRLSKDFKKTYYTVPWVSAFPKMNLGMLGTGFEESIEVVSDVFGDHFDSIDLFVFPDVYFGPLQEQLVKMGKTVWGGRMGEDLELCREGMKEILTELGQPVGNYEVVKGTAALRSYLKSHKDVFVKINRWRGTFETFHSPNYKAVEPKLDEVEYNLGAFKYVVEFIVEDALNDRVEYGTDAWSIDGKYPSKLFSGVEIKDKGFLGTFADYKDIPKPLVAFNEAIAPTLKAYGYRGFFSSEVRIGKDMEPYMIDFCFDDETEVLTENGWKLFKDCDPEERVATRNPNTGEIEYQKPTRQIARHYEGDMVEITNRKKSIELRCTPEHDILRTDRENKKLFKEKAGELTDKGYIPRTGIWNPVNPPTKFTLPGYHHEWDFIGQYGHFICKKVKHEEPKEIPMEDWAAFLAWYLAEGSLSGVPKGREGIKYVTQISQTKYPKRVKAVLDKLGFKYNYDGKMFRISSAQLSTHLQAFGLCSEKFVPSYIKKSSKVVIRAFLDAYCGGDGSLRGGESKRYYTTSNRMADDLQELIFKSGSVGNISTNPDNGTHDKLIISENATFTDFWFETGKRKDNYIKRTHYKGMIYCNTVDNGVIYIRRHGKPLWCPQCARAPSPPNELYQEIYTNLPDVIWSGANGIVVDPIAEFKFGAEIMIHSSWADKNWQPVDFPEKLRDRVKLRNACKINGRYYVIPQQVGLPEIGAVIGLGNTKEEAIAEAKEVGKQVSGYYIEVPQDALDAAEEEIAKMDKLGLKIM